MGYAKMIKWNKAHRKGISYKKGYMGFNSSGITSEEINLRENKFIEEMKQKTLEERKDYWKNISECIALRLGSWEWTWCAFQRNFVFNGQVN